MRGFSRWIGVTDRSHRRVATSALAVAIAGFGLAGCRNSACEDAVEKICAKACECGKCGLAAGNENAQIVLSYDDEADCQATANCDDTEASDADLEACAADVDDAACRDGAVVVPESCNEKD
jgi:hypothetical protein